VELEVLDNEEAILDLRAQSAHRQATCVGPETKKHENMTLITNSMEPTVNKSLRNRISKKKCIQNEIM